MNECAVKEFIDEIRRSLYTSKEAVWVYKVDLSVVCHWQNSTAMSESRSLNFSSKNFFSAAVPGQFLQRWTMHILSQESQTNMFIKSLYEIPI